MVVSVLRIPCSPLSEPHVPHLQLVFIFCVMPCRSVTSKPAVLGAATILRQCDGPAEMLQELETASLQISQTPEWKALEDHVTEIEQTYGPTCMS